MTPSETRRLFLWPGLLPSYWHMGGDKDLQKRYEEVLEQYPLPEHYVPIPAMNADVPELLAECKRAKAEAVKPRNSAYKIAYERNVTDKNRAKFEEHLQKYIELQAAAQAAYNALPHQVFSS